jgi:hypothetical protein
MRTATVEKEWAEVRRNWLKTEDWSWTVTLVEDGVEIDELYINNETDAKMIAGLFESGAFTLGEYRQVCFDTAFA